MTDLLEKHAQEHARRSCKHPNLVFGKLGYDLSCVDCKRRWIAAMDGFEVPDYTYSNQALATGEFRHSPDEAPRREPKPESSKIR